MPSEITIIIPVYNDWEALSKLLHKIKFQSEKLKPSVSILIVNDCSSQKMDIPVMDGLSIEVMELLRNIGHQKAIAIGLSYLAENKPGTPALVMDADGEDKPEDIPLILRKMEDNPGKIVFAERNKRSESFVFKFFYVIYRFIFSVLTGKVISFGNFSGVPAELTKKLSFVSEIWNNYPGGVIRSKLPYTSIRLDRGTRLAGESKMNFVSLVMHGMSAIAVFLDATAVRLMLFAIVLISCGLIGISIILFMKIGLDIATPGWASNLASAFFIIVLQGFFISLFLVFMVLSYRNNKHFIPLLDYKAFIDKIEKHPNLLSRK